MTVKALLSVVVTAALAVLLGRAVLQLGEGGVSLAASVQTHLEASGVAHPVTAVLLNFRSYDTWLELIVLLVAAVGAFEGRLQWRARYTRLASDPLLSWLIWLVLPVMVLMAGYLLQAGAYAPGGAFQAGAVLAAAVVLLHLAGRSTLAAVPATLLRGLLVLAVALFAALAVAGLLVEGALLQYPPRYAGATIMLLESAAAVSIGVALAALVTGQHGKSD